MFVECSAPEPLPPEDGWARRLEAPRCGVDGYARWAAAVSAVGRLLAERLREVHFLAAVPVPREGDKDTADLPAVIGQTEASFPTTFVQLVYPWVRTQASQELPEGLESPDGVLAGLLARNALTRGTFRSAAGLELAGVLSLGPELRRDAMEKPGEGGLALIDRVALFGPTPSGLRLLSDVSASGDRSYRPAGVSRLVSTLVRAARRLGEDSTFETSGEALWTRVQDRASTVLRALWDLGALRGATPGEAFDVRCDRSTMSQQDIDQGRVIARVRFEAAAAVEAITVVLALDEGGQVSLAPETGLEAP
jgi:phage tail sheath protein FI